MKSNSHGNVLFLILIAVALFAALSYAVTQSTRSGKGDTSKEKAELATSQILQFTTTVVQAVQRMRLAAGCPDDGISFESPNYYDLGNNANYTYSPDVATACKVFNPSGGNVSLQQMPPGSSTGPLNYFITGEYAVSGVGTNDGTANSSDLMIVARRISREACIKINQELGIDNPSGEPPAEGLNLAGPATGTNDYFSVTNETFNGTYIPPAIFSNPALVGQPAGCFFATGNSAYGFYRVLFAR